ncbi:hypothetical protein [Streptomyces sp. NBC_01197]|uniref:hypothetical protein n=1 Tax=Streptomyces sp. NBC_01197 TaxID=2903768 RepID=UPI002E0FD05F|nr:hypothetical protein OG452_22215 [Streptomyces sp. NBC_01197]
MTKKRSPLKNRLARFETSGDHGVRVAVLRAEASGLSIGEVCWQLLQPVCPLEVTDASELTEHLERRPPFTSAEATGWVLGALGGDLADSRADHALMEDPKLRSIEDDVIVALGPDARWYTNSDHPLQRFRRVGSGRSWEGVTRATYDLVVAARGNGLDLVLVRTEED